MQKCFECVSHNNLPQYNGIETRIDGFSSLLATTKKGKHVSWMALRNAHLDSSTLSNERGAGGHGPLQLNHFFCLAVANAAYANTRLNRSDGP